MKAGPWYMYLSGDDPATEKFEAFNNLFGGYPNDDELYLNTWMRESGISMYTNINLNSATAGAMRGRIAKKSGDQVEQQQMNEAAAAKEKALMDNFKKAFTACMEGKSYTVK